MLIPRPYQTRSTKKVIKALKERGNSLLVAPTGAGKSYMLAMLSAAFKGQHAVLQHRDELVMQNIAKYRKVNDDRKVGLFTADVKTWRNDCTFAMAQTLCRNLDTIPKLDLFIVDECHHIAAPSYRAIIDRVREVNPKCKIAGVTATPERSDKKSLRGVFDNLGDQITLKELIGLGFLVPPRAFIIDINKTHQELRALGNVSASEQFNVDAILNKKVVTDEVIRNWKESASGRQTIVFCSTVAHANAVAEAFRNAGVSAEAVSGEMSSGQRKSVLGRLRSGELTVVVNCMVLTEGFDYPPVSCIVLLRLCSAKGTLVQMVGRGLRTVNPEEYPGVIKKDCIVLDFGTSIIVHGDLEQLDGLHEEREAEKGEATTKTCPEGWAEVYRYPDRNGNVGCGAELPAQTKTCPFCGYVFERMDGEEDEFAPSVSLTEVDLINASPFRWLTLWGSDSMLMAGGFDAWVGVFSPDGGDTFHALGHTISDKGRLHKLCVSSRMVAVSAADDFLRTHEKNAAAKKAKRWLDEPATERQVELLNLFGYELAAGFFGTQMSKYAASMHCNFQFNRHLIEGAIGV